MDKDECIWILRNLQYTDRNLWETTRFKAFSTISMFSKNKMKMTDLIRFPWDTEQVEVIETDAEGRPMTDEERKAVEEEVLRILNKK